MVYSNNSTLRDRTFDRLKKSISGERADGHSVFHYYTFPFFHNVTNVPLDKYFHDPKTIFDTQLEVLEMLEKCGSLAPDPGPVAECSALNGKVVFDMHGYISVEKSGISTLEEALALKVGDPYGQNYMHTALEALEYMVAHAPEDVKVNPPVIMGAFTVAAQLRGISEFCTDTILNPDLVHAMLDIATQTSIAYMKAAEKIMGGTLHHILVGDDLSSFLGQDSYRKWVMPTYAALQKAFPDTEFWLHNDARAGHIIPCIVESGFSAWQYAPSIETEKAVIDSQSGITLLGGLSPVEFQHYSAQQTYDVCLEKLKSFNGNQKCVLGVGGSINQIPVENLLAMFRVADEYKI